MLLFILATSVAAQVPDVELARTLPLDDAVFFGEVTDLDVMDDGSVVVLDNRSHQIVLFRPDGRLERTMGRQGGGPGELQGAAELEVLPDQSIAVLDYGNLRFTVWDRRGNVVTTVPLHVPLEPGFWPHELYWTEHGPLLKVSQFAPDKPFYVLRLSATPDAVQDTLLSVSPDDSITCTFCPWTVGPAGDMRVAQGDTVYPVHRMNNNSGTVASSWTSQRYPAAPRSSEEIEELQNLFRERAGREGGTAGAVSPYKPRFIRLTLGSDDDGRRDGNVISSDSTVKPVLPASPEQS